MAVVETTEVRDERAWGLPPSLAGGETSVAPRRPKWRWPGPIALLAWIVYSAAAVWMTESLHLELGDSIARMNDAREMLFSRDPHLAAIGLYWMPLPTVGQLPFMLVLSPLHLAELSGPLACAFVGALTVLVMARICWVLSLSKPAAIALTLVYAFNPIVVYTNGNGMSEAWLFFTLAVAMLGFIRWSKDHRTVDLAVLAAGLSGVALARYEGFVLAPVIGVLAALNDGRSPPQIDSIRIFLSDCHSRWRRWLTTASLVIVPTYFVLALWMLMNYVIQRHALYWYTLQKQTGHTTAGSYPNLPAHNPVSILAYVLRMIAAVIPGLLVIGPLLLLRRRYHEFITGLGILAGAIVWPLIVLAGLFANESAGAPRYFEPSIVFVSVGAIWLVATFRTKIPSLRRAIPFLVVGVLVVCTVAGTVAMENPARTSIEQENQFFTRILGHNIAPLPDTYLSRAPIWKQLATDLDRKLGPKDKVLVDVSTVDFGAFVFTRDPGQYIVNSDRDYQRIVADPAGKFDFLILPSAKVEGGDTGQDYLLLQNILTTPTGGKWVMWRSYYIATVFEFVRDGSGPS